MKRIVFRGHVLDMYDSIEDLPIMRFQQFNKYAVIDAGIGSNIDAIDKRMDMIDMLISDDPKKAKMELMNMRQAYHFVMSGTSPQFSSFMVLIHKLDGKVLEDHNFTDQGILDLINKLSRFGLSFGTVKEYLKVFKKKVEQELSLFFASLTEDPKLDAFYTNMLRRAKLMMESLESKTEDVLKAINAIEKDMLQYIGPKNFFGANGKEVQHIKSFEKTCIVLKQHGLAIEPEKLTTIAFYQALETIKEMIDKQRISQITKRK